jgi:ABC-type Fe3+-hydroxamate transport system substrate-binding protein
MAQKSSFKIPRKFRSFLIFLAIVLIAYLLIKILPTDAQKVPTEFLNAKYNASSVAQDIVSISNQLTNDLDEISRLESEKKYTEAINLLAQALEKNKEAREKAVLLSEELAKMALAVPNISPSGASQIALQAISSETTLISRLIAYNDYLNQLLEELRLEFLGKSSGGNKIQELISKINEEVRAINELNAKYNTLMEKFDGKQ